jgi:hypothetical protein
MILQKRTAEHGEILREDIDQPAVDRAPAGDDAVARHLLVFHAEIAAAMGDIHVVFFEGPLVEQHVQPFARGQLALGVLRRDALFAAAHASRLAPFLELLKNIEHEPPPSPPMDLSVNHD